SRRRNQKKHRPLDFASAGMETATRVATTTSRASTARQKMPWWHIRFFSGMVNDVKRRAPYYWSDWVDAWDYRVVPSTSMAPIFDELNDGMANAEDSLYVLCEVGDVLNRHG